MMTRGVCVSIAKHLNHHNAQTSKLLNGEAAKKQQQDRKISGPLHNKLVIAGMIQLHVQGLQAQRCSVQKAAASEEHSLHCHVHM